MDRLKTLTEDHTEATYVNNKLAEENESMDTKIKDIIVTLKSLKKDHTCAKELIVYNEDMNSKLTAELNYMNEKYSRTSEELREFVDRCSTEENKLEDLSEKHASLVQKSSLFEEDNSFIPVLNKEVKKLRKLFAKSEDERTRALEEINVLERQKDEMY